MSLAVLILAGGKSQRMGHDKVLLKKDGVTLLRRTWDIARSRAPQVWVMTPWRDRYAPYLPEATQWIEETPPEPNEPPAGPLVAFAQALTTIQADWILLLACDLPELRADVLGQWAEALPQISAEAIALLPKRAGRWEPLCGFYRSSCLQSLEDHIAAGGRSFQRWLDHQPVEEILNAPPDMLINCNTPEDWQRYQEV